MSKSARPYISVLAAGTLLLSACGGGSDADSSDADPSGAEAPDSVAASADSSFNEADVMFAQGMIPHHEQAVEMASIALRPESGASAEVQELATAIQAAQDPEIELMTQWLQAWGEPVEMGEMDGMDHSGMDGMDGMMSEDQMTSLTTLSGAEFDEAWVTMMIAHHRGAIEQAEAVKGAGSDPQVLALADEIIATQQAEITRMEALSAG